MPRRILQGPRLCVDELEQHYWAAKEPRERAELVADAVASRQGTNRPSHRQGTLAILDWADREALQCLLNKRVE